MSDKTKNVPDDFWHGRSFKILTGIAVFTVILQLSLPFAAKFYLQKWLVENGAETAVIEKVRINPFTGVAALEGVDLKHNGVTVFSDSTIFLNVGLTNLFGREIMLQQITLEDIMVDSEISEDGTIRIASYSIAPTPAGTDESATQTPEQKEESTPWIFRARSINLQNVSFRFRQPDLNVEFIIEEALIERLNTDPNDTTGNLYLKGTINGAPIKLDLPSLVITPSIDLGGTVSIADFKLNDLAGFLGEYLKPFQGIAGIDGKVQFTMEENGDLGVHYDGFIHLDKGSIGGEGWGTKGTINYKGIAAFAMNQNDMVVDVDGHLQGLQAGFDMPDPVIDIDNADINITGKTKVTIAEEVIVDTSASLQLAPTTFGMDILNTATGKTSWKGKVLVETGTETKDLLVRADGVLRVAEPKYSMDVNDSLMEVHNQQISWDGVVEYTMGAGADSNSAVHTDGTMKGKDTLFTLPGVIQVSQKGLDLSGKTAIAIGTDIAVSYQGDISLNDTTVDAEEIRIGDSQLSWSGKAGYTLTEQDQAINLNGSLKVADLYTEVAKMHISQKSLATDSDCELTLAETPSFKGTLSLNGEELEIQKEDTPMLNLAKMSLDDAKGNKTGGIDIASLRFHDLAIHSSPDIPVSATIPQIAINGIKSPDLESGDIHNITIEKPLVLDKEKKTQLAALETIKIDTIHLTKDMLVTVQAIEALKGVFIKEKKSDPLATLASVKTDQLNYSQKNGLVVNSINVDSIHATLLKKKKPAGSDSATKDETKNSSDDSSTEKVAKKEATKIPVKIKQIIVTGKSGFKFTDESLARKFRTVFALKSLQLDNIDLNKPEQPFSYQLKGTFDKYAPLKIKGQAAPFAANIMVKHKVSLQNLPMQNVSPYVIEAIGSYFPSGMLDYSSEAKIAEGKIDMQSHLLFTDLEIESVEGELAAELDNQLPIPLGLALSMIRKKDGTIEIDVPITGELSNLQVGVVGLIVPALGKAITLAVTPYLAYTVLGPAGALVYLGAGLGQAMLSTNLPDLEFEQGAKELTEEQKESLKKAGKQIEEDTESIYSLCARVRKDELSTVEQTSSSDPQAVLNEKTRTELFELGEQRALLVKNFLLSNFSIDEENLLLCNPGLEFDKDSKASVSFKKSDKDTDLDEEQEQKPEQEQ